MCLNPKDSGFFVTCSGFEVTFMSAKRFLWLLFIFSAFSSPGICSEQEGIDCSFGLFQKGKNREIVEINKALWLKARKDADDVLMMDAALSVSMAYVALNQPDSARQWLEDAVQWAEALDSPWVTARANQAFGVSAMVDYLDFDSAYGYLFKALEAAEDADDRGCGGLGGFVLQPYRSVHFVRQYPFGPRA